MRELSEVLKGKSIRDKKDGEDYDAEKLQKKVGVTQYMIYKEAMIDTIFIITKEVILSFKVDRIDKSFVYNHIKSELVPDKTGEKLASDFLWFRKGDSLQSVLRWAKNFLRF